jgi:anti-anti-sigma factor
MTATLPTLTRTTSPVRRWWALHVGGDLDLATAPDLEARLARALAFHRDDGLVLDLSEVTFMDCAGLRPVLRARNRIEHLWLRGVHPRVRQLLDLAGVTDTLRILPTAQLWPAEADPLLCHVVLDDVSDHRPAQPLVRLGRVPV